MMDELINNIMQSPENTNPNVLRGQLQKIAGSGSGMPDATGLPDGTALIAVGSKFIPVEGYGYSVGGGSYGPFYWDGVYHADDPDAIVVSNSGYNLILKKIADDNSFIDASSSIHILEESGDEYDLTASDSGYDSTILFMDSGSSHMATLVRDPDAWSEMGIDANDTGLFFYTFSIDDVPSDGDQLGPPAEYTVVNSETVAAFNKKYIPTDLDYVTEAQVDLKINAKIISGTAEYEDGVTNLDNGVIYLQYEV